MNWNGVTPRDDKARFRAAVAVHVTLLIYTLLLLRSMTGGRRLFWGDIQLYFEPMAHFGQRALLQGRLPLWNPLILNGQPYLGNPQMSLFYPATLLLGSLNAWNYLSLLDALHLYLCGAATYWFLARWTRHRVSALIGALVFEGSGCLLGRLQFPPMIVTTAYIPLFLLCIDRNLDRHSPAYRPILALVVGFMLLGGHPQMAYLGLMGGALYGSCRLWRITGEYTIPKARFLFVLQTVLSILGWAFVGMLLAAAQLLPTVQLFVASSREELSAAQANRFVLELPQLLTLLLPHLLGSPAHGDYWGSGNAWEPAIFIGWIPLGLICGALYGRVRAMQVRFWMGIALLSLWLALGNSGGIYWVAFHLIPGLSNFHDPARFVLPAVFAFATLSAIGSDALLAARPQISGRVIAAMALLVAVPLVLYAPEWLPTLPLSRLVAQPDPMTSRRDEAGDGRIYQPEHQIFWRRFVTNRYSDYGPEDTKAFRAVISTMLPNLNMNIYQASASGYEPVPINTSATLDGLGRVALRRDEPNLDHILDMMNVSSLYLPVTESLQTHSLHQIRSDEKPLDMTRIYRNPEAPGWAWLVRRTRHIDGSLRIASALAAPQFDCREEAILSGGTGKQERDLQPNPAVPIPSHGAVIDRLDDQSLSLTVHGTGSVSYLVVSIAAYPGWKAAVDGIPTTLFRTDGALLGLYTPAGTHHVRIFFRPTSVQIGGYVSLLALCLLVSTVTAMLTASYRSGRSGSKTIQP